MKYFLISLTIFVVSSITVFSSDLECDGQPAEIAVIHFDPPLGSSCDGTVIVYYCCRENSPPVVPPSINIIGAGITDLECFIGQDFSDPAFWETVRQKLIAQLTKHSYLACSFDVLSSCDNPPYANFVDIETASCVKMINEDGEFPTLVGCEEEGTCSNTYSACMDYSESPPKVKIEKVGSSLPPSQPLCATGILNVPPGDIHFNPDGSIDIDPFETTCYTLCY